MDYRNDTPEAISMKLRIIHAIDKPLETMSVEELCQAAKISKQTFYNYFESKYLIGSWWSYYCERLFLDRIGFDLSWEEGLVRHTQLMMTNSEFLIYSALGKGNGSLMAEGETVARRIAAINAALKFRQQPLTDELRFSVDVYAHNFVDRALEYFKTGDVANKGITAPVKLFIAIIPPILYQALQVEPLNQSTQLQNFARLDEIVAGILDKPVDLHLVD